MHSVIKRAAAPTVVKVHMNGSLEAQVAAKRARVDASAVKPEANGVALGDHGKNGMLHPGMTQAHDGEVAVADLRFAAAHFIAFKGFREPLHGHDFKVSVRAGGVKMQADGSNGPLADLKEAARATCTYLNQRTILPSQSEALQVRSPESAPGQLEVRCEGDAKFLFPEADCAVIPVMHTNPEELAEYLWRQALASPELRAALTALGAEWVEVSVSIRPNQLAKYRKPVSQYAAAGGLDTAGAKTAPRGCLACSMVCEDCDPLASNGMVGGQCKTEFGRCPPNPVPAAITSEPVDVAEAAYRMLLSSLGPAESSRPELIKTPRRAAKAWVELTSGLKADPEEVVNEALFDEAKARDLVAVRDMPFHSLCEHHLLPFSGVAHVAYLPEGKVLGLSKFPRLLRVFARRLSLQERLTAEYAEMLEKLLQPKALAVSMEATHGCMCARGVGVNAYTRTLALRGEAISDPSIREHVVSGVACSARAHF